VIRPRALLAVARDASRTGAPRVLASLLDELGVDGAIDPERTRVVLGRGGPVEDELGRVASVRVLGPASDLASRAAARLGPRARPRGDRVAVGVGLARRPVRSDPGPPDLVWANGAAAVRMATALPRPARRAPLVAHVHEMSIGVRRSLDGGDAHQLLDRAAVIVAVSRAVATHLVDDLGLPTDRVAVHHAWVPGLAPQGLTPVTPRRPLLVPDDALVVGGCGAIGWRKGTDLFLDLARRHPPPVDGRPVHLVWVGRPDRPGDDRRAAADVVLRGLDSRVHFVGEVDDAGPWLAGFDLLALTSRQDPFPLVVLEAGARGVAVVGFRSGGLTEAIPDGDHDISVAELFDGDGLAERVEALLAAPHARRALGGDLRTRVLSRHAAAPSVRALWSDVAARLARA
jgi:glycosyltransferase involved in cell wall biosynthesis